MHSPRKNQEACAIPDGVTVLGVQYQSIVSLFSPLRDRVELSLIHFNDWWNVWRGRKRADAVGAPPELGWEDWHLPPGWTSRFSPWTMPMIARRVRRTWRRRGWINPKLVLTVPYLLPVARKLGLQRTIYRVVDNYQAYWPDRAKTIARQEEELVRETCATVVTSRLLAEWFTERIPSCAHKIHYVPNGISPSMLREPRAALAGPRPLQRQFPQQFMAKTGPVVGHYATIAPRYGGELLLALAERLPDFRFILMGQVVSGASAYTETMKALAEKPNVVMTGYLKEPDSREVLWQCDIMIIPIPMDDLGRFGCPNRLWTFMASGRPIVSTSMPEVTQFGDLVYIADDPEAMASALVAAAAERDARRIEARVEIAGQHVWPKLADRMWSIISSH